MQFEMHAHGLELDDDLRSHVERRLRFALARFGERVRDVSVLLTDVNGPKGGYDLQCKVLAELATGEDVVIRELHHDPFAGVSRAAERVSHAVARRLDRWTTLRRGRDGRARSRDSGLSDDGTEPMTA